MYETYTKQIQIKKHQITKLAEAKNQNNSIIPNKECKCSFKDSKPLLFHGLESFGHVEVRASELLDFHLQDADVLQPPVVDDLPSVQRVLEEFDLLVEERYLVVTSDQLTPDDVLLGYHLSESEVKRVRSIWFHHQVTQLSPLTTTDVAFETKT